MEIQKTEVAKNPEIEDIMEITKKRRHDEVEDCEKQQQAQTDEETRDEDEDKLRNLLLSDIGDLPLSPPSATQVNFVTYFITGSFDSVVFSKKPFLIVLNKTLFNVFADFTKSGHDQYIYRHANGYDIKLCSFCISL